MSLDTPCREWNMSRNKHGYGVRNQRKKYGTDLVHRQIMMMAGHDVAGLVVRHACDNPPCFRYDHLILGTQADNLNDMFDRGRNNNPSGDRHARAKITWGDADTIRQRHAGGDSYRTIAEDYAIHHTTVGEICRGLIWIDKAREDGDDADQADTE